MNLTSSETASADANSVNGDEEKASTTNCSARVNADSSLAKSSSLVKSLVDPLQRQHKDKKVVGLAEGVRRQQIPAGQLRGSRLERLAENNGDIPLEDDEKYSREKVEQRPIVLAIVGYYTALKVEKTLRMMSPCIFCFLLTLLIKSTKLHRREDICLLFDLNQQSHHSGGVSWIDHLLA